MAEELGSASSSSNKRMKKVGVDSLSSLPDSLLVSILSLLSTREAIRTCVLSRRWLFLWTGLPALAFAEESEEDENVSKFVAGVRKYLAVYGGNHLQRFEVSFNYNKCFASAVNTCVQFALRHKVEDFALLLKGWVNEYLLPQMMYSNSYLTRLSLEGCIMAPKNTIEWGALSSLYLDRVQFHGNAIENILSSCPVLYDLTLNFCSHSPKLDRLHVKSQSLRELTLIGWDLSDIDLNNGNLVMEVSAPFIHYAKISPYFGGRKFQLMNISSLVEADIDLEVYRPSLRSRWTGYTGRLFEILHHVKTLKVGPYLIQALGDMVLEEDMHLSQSGVECLQLNATIYNKDTANGIVFLLESSPNLKKLVISLWCNNGQDGLEEFELNLEFLHLKTVTITVHEEPECVAKTLPTLVRLLLKRAPVLEKLAIDFSLPLMRYFTPPEFTKIALTLLSYTRASAKAAVQLSPFCS